METSTSSTLNHIKHPFCEVCVLCKAQGHQKTKNLPSTVMSPVPSPDASDDEDQLQQTCDYNERVTGLVLIRDQNSNSKHISATVPCS